MVEKRKQTEERDRGVHIYVRMHAMDDPTREFSFFGLIACLKASELVDYGIYVYVCIYHIFICQLAYNNSSQPTSHAYDFEYRERKR